MPKTSLLLAAALLLGPPHAFLASAGGEEKTETGSAEQQLVLDVVSWIKAEGGSVDDARQEVRRERPGARTPGPRGVFATEAIAKGDVLLRVPWDLIVFGSSQSEGNNGECDAEEEEGGECSKSEEDGAEESLCSTVRALAKELSPEGGQDGEEKQTISPFAKLLLDPSSAPSIPETWTEAGKKIFNEVLGDAGAIPPTLDYAGRYRTLWKNTCKGDADDAAMEKALFLTVTRSRVLSSSGGDDVTTLIGRAVIPFADLYNHRNGRYTNVDVVLVEAEGEGERTKKEVRAVATRNVRKGEQLFVSYGVGTGFIMRDYGFVEFPQRWRFDFGGKKVVEYDLDPGPDGDLVPKWVVRPDGKTVDLMEKEMNRLQLVEADLYTASRTQTKSGEMTKEELNIIWKYHGALINALDHSIIEARGRKSNVQI